MDSLAEEIDDLRELVKAIDGGCLVCGVERWGKVFRGKLGVAKASGMSRYGHV